MQRDIAAPRTPPSNLEQQVVERRSAVAAQHLVQPAERLDATPTESPSSIHSQRRTPFHRMTPDVATSAARKAMSGDPMRAQAGSDGVRGRLGHRGRCDGGLLYAGRARRPPRPVSQERDAPLISVVVPTYDRAAFLTRGARSVVAQTVEDWECVVVDDGSPEPVSLPESIDPRIRLVRAAERRPGGGRNAGLLEGARRVRHLSRRRRPLHRRTTGARSAGRGAARRRGLLGPLRRRGEHGARGAPARG